MIADRPGRIAQSDNLSVSGRVAVADRSISGSRHDLTVDDKCCSDRNLSASGGSESLFERGLHESKV